MTNFSFVYEHLGGEKIGDVLRKSLAKIEKDFYEIQDCGEGYFLLKQE